MLEVKSCKIMFYLEKTQVNLTATRRKVKMYSPSWENPLTLVTYDDLIRFLHCVKEATDNELVRLSARTNSNVHQVFGNVLSARLNSCSTPPAGDLETLLKNFGYTEINLTDKSKVTYHIYGSYDAPLYLQTHMASTVVSDRWFMLFYILSKGIPLRIRASSDLGIITLPEALKVTSPVYISCIRQFGPKKMTFHIGDFNLFKLRKIFPQVAQGCAALAFLMEKSNE